MIKQQREPLTNVRSVPPTSVGQSTCEELGLLQGVAKDSVDMIQTYSGTNDLGLTTEEEVTAILKMQECKSHTVRTHRKMLPKIRWRFWKLIFPENDEVHPAKVS